MDNKSPSETPDQSQPKQIIIEPNLELVSTFNSLAPQLGGLLSSRGQMNFHYALQSRVLDRFQANESQQAIIKHSDGKEEIISLEPMRLSNNNAETLFMLLDEEQQEKLLEMIKRDLKK